MTVKQLKKLRTGDEVFWTDPDNGICSRTLTISSIEVMGTVVTIVDTDGDTLECFARELS